MHAPASKASPPSSEMVLPSLLNFSLRPAVPLIASLLARHDYRRSLGVLPGIQLSVCCKDGLVPSGQTPLQSSSYSSCPLLLFPGLQKCKYSWGNCLQMRWKLLLSAKFAAFHFVFIPQKRSFLSELQNHCYSNTSNIPTHTSKHLVTLIVTLIGLKP